MKAIAKSILAAALILASALSVSCTKELIQDDPLPIKNDKFSLTVIGQLGEFNSDGQTRSELANVVRVKWAANDKVYVYDGTQCLGSLTATVTDPEGRVAELSGDIDEPTGDKLYLIHSNLFTTAPTVTDNTITVDLSTQTLTDADKIPFVVYAVVDYTAASIQSLVTKFSFATSALTSAVTGLDASTAITAATLSGVNTKCVLNLSGEGDIVSGSTPGTIQRTAGLGSSNSRGTAFIHLAVPVSSATSKSLKITQGSHDFLEADFSSSAVSSGRSISVANLVIAISGTLNGHDWVQLWENGPKWATTNVGASSPEAFGGYYQWAGIEDVTSTDINLNWSNCPYYNSINIGWTKYVSSGNSSYWSGEGSTPDDKLVLEPEDDIARSWGSTWRMPTDGEWTELREKCSWEWTEDYNGTGVAGRTVTSKTNGNSIFLPAAGFRSGTSLISAGVHADYWSSSLYSGSFSSRAWGVLFYLNEVDRCIEDRYYGQSVRPVSD